MVIVIDPRLSETARIADMHIALKHGNNSPFLRALIAIIVEKGRENTDYTNKYVADWEKIIPWFKSIDIDGSLRICGVPRKQAAGFAKVLT